MSPKLKRYIDSFPWSSNAPYAQAVEASGLVFLSGQYGSTDAGALISNDFADQARQTFTNIATILKQAELDYSDVIHLRYYLTRPSDFATFKAIRAEFLGDSLPGASVLYVSALAIPEMLIEVEAVAAR